MSAGKGKRKGKAKGKGKGKEKGKRKRGYEGLRKDREVSIGDLHGENRKKEGISPDEKRIKLEIPGKGSE